MQSVHAAAAGRVQEARRPADVLCGPRGRRPQRGRVACPSVRCGAGEEMQEARDGRLKIVDSETRDVHSVAWMLRRAVRPRGCRAQRSRAACRSVRCRQQGGPGRMQEARRGGSTMGRGMDSAGIVRWMLCGAGIGATQEEAGRRCTVRHLWCFQGVAPDSPVAGTF